MDHYRVGDLVIFRSVVCGSIPCKVIDTSLVFNGVRDVQRYRLLVTATRSAWKRGMIIDTSPNWIRKRG